MRTSPTEDNLSPSFWTCFSHYHEKVATLRSAFFDITHSERKKHSSLLGVLFSGADNQIRTGDLVLTKDVLYSKKRKCSKKIKTAENTQYLVLFPPFFYYLTTILRKMVVTIFCRFYYHLPPF